MYKYFRNKKGEVYAYSQEQISKTIKLTTLEERVKLDSCKYEEASNQLSVEQEKLGLLEDTEDNAQEIELLEVEIAKLQAIIDDYLNVKKELDSIQPVVYEMRENMQNFHKMTDEEVEAHINPPKTHEQLMDEAESKKSFLLSLATSKIDPLQDAVDLDVATDDELSQLKLWKKFRVLVNRVDTSQAPDIEFPQQPVE